jgi:hypothetical protein
MKIRKFDKCIIILIFIIIISLFTNITYESFDNKNSLNHSKWIVLLTTCVDINSNSSDIEYRKKLYHGQITHWLTRTNLPIFVVESSDYPFDEIKNDKLTVFHFKQDSISSSTQGESESIKYALKELMNNEKYIHCSHILKVTGRYFLDDIENKLEIVEQNNDLYLQIHRHSGWQNSEYYGIKKELFTSFIESLPVDYLMEQHLYDFSLNKKWTTIGPFPNTIPRGGDSQIIHELFSSNILS